MNEDVLCRGEGMIQRSLKVFKMYLKADVSMKRNSKYKDLGIHKNTLSQRSWKSQCRAARVEEEEENIRK